MKNTSNDALNIVPVFIGLIVFLIWIVDHNVERRENEKR